MKSRIIFACAICLCLSMLHYGQAQNLVVPNASFETGANNLPQSWTPGGKGLTAWENTGHSGNHSISVSATAAGESLYWSCNTLTLKPLTLYQFSFWSKHEGDSDGSIVSGLSGVNHDFPVGNSTWTQHSFVFLTPDKTDGLYLRLGQWNGQGKVLFDDVALHEIQPLPNDVDGLKLGAGERISGDTYSYQSDLNRSNYFNGLQSVQAGFNTNRWVFGNGASLLYRHDIGAHLQKSAKITANIGYYQSGKLIIEASSDGQKWMPVTELDHTGNISADLPASLFPASVIYVRLRAANAVSAKGDSAPGSFQVDSYSYSAALQGTIPDATGETRFLTVEQMPSNMTVHVNSLGSLMPGDASAASLHLSSEQNLQPLKTTLTLTPQNGNSAKVLSFGYASDGNTSAQDVKIPYQFDKTGDWKAQLEVTQNNKIIYAASADFSVPAYYAVDFGERIGSADDLWWAGSNYKIRQERALPPATDKSTFVPIQLARNEYEAVQVIAKPQKDISNVTAKVSDLIGPGGAHLSAKNITIDSVAYVYIQHPTDATGASGYWPDPLPPLNKPITLKANQNQPFWITVFAPKDIPAGIYAGKVLLSGDGWQREVPLQVTVWDFTLSDETHIKSALGLSAGRIAPYHHVSGDDLVKLMDKYYANFAAHRISSYDPVYGAGISVDWGFGNDATWQGGTVDTSAPFAGKASLRIDDNDPHSVVSASWPTPLLVTNGQKYTLKFAVRTALAGQKYQVSINTNDAAGKWISGNNLDVTKAGDGQWQQVSIDISKHLANPKVHSLTIGLRPTHWTDDGAGTGTVWFDDVQLIENDKTDLLAGKGDFESAFALVKAQQVKVDFAAFDKAMENAVAKYHITTFRLGLTGSGGGGADSYRAGKIGNYIQGSPQYDILFGSYVKQLQDHLQQKGWLDKAFLYWYDEPTPEVYGKITEMGDLIHRYAPKLKWMLTEQPGPELEKSVDIFCPILNLYDHETATGLQKQGKEVWWYICTGPKAPYVGEFIDRPGIEPRLWLWQTWKNKVQGILIWATVYWTSKVAYPDSLQNPWKDPESWSTTGGKWGNGDGRFLYPPQRDPNTDKSPNMDAPINSIRWEALRDGIEDYEYLWTLQQQVNQMQQKKSMSAADKTWLTSAKVLLQIPDSISTDLTHFNTTPEAILTRRAQIAEAIVAGEKVSK